MHSPGVCDYLVLVLPPCHIFRHQVSSTLSPALNIDWLFLFRLLWRTIICCSPAFRLQVFRIRINRLVFPPFFSPNQISACEPRYLRTSPKKAQIEAFIRSRPLGDFFVLYQLGKNLNRYFFVEFVTRLSDLEEREGAKGDEDEGDTIIDMFIKPAYDESDTLKKD